MLEIFDEDLFNFRIILENFENIEEFLEIIIISIIL